MTALSKEVRLIVPNSMLRESQVANLPAHPPRRKVEIQDSILEVVRLTPKTARSRTLQPITREINVESPILIEKQASTQRCALFVGPNIPCGDAANFEH